MGRQERGMVTAELAVASLLVAVMVAAVGWLAAVIGLAMRCQDTAWEVARQEARNDSAAATRARVGGPPGARVAVTRSGDRVRVVVELEARPWAGWLPAVPLSAAAVTLVEPSTP